MAVHSPLNAFSFDISVIEIGQEIKLQEHLKFFWITRYVAIMEKTSSGLWYRCTSCGFWAHSECSGVETPKNYKCDLCIQRDNVNVKSRRLNFYIILTICFIIYLFYYCSFVKCFNKIVYSDHLIYSDYH
jgi:hypothetical protein